MYTGRTEQPCCLCDDADTATRLDLPPRAVQLMRNGEPIAWRDIVGTLSVHFCQSDWDLVRDLVVDLDQNPLPRCNVARASFTIREDFEALLNATRDEPDQTALESESLDRARHVVAEYDEDPMLEERDLVEARLVLDSLAELGVAEN
jgi:hypothetical protein